MEDWQSESNAMIVGVVMVVKKMRGGGSDNEAGMNHPHPRRTGSEIQIARMIQKPGGRRDGGNVPSPTRTIGSGPNPPPLSLSNCPGACERQTWPKCWAEWLTDTPSSLRPYPTPTMLFLLLLLPLRASAQLEPDPHLFALRSSPACSSSTNSPPSSLSTPS